MRAGAAPAQDASLPAGGVDGPAEAAEDGAPAPWVNGERWAAAAAAGGAGPGEAVRQRLTALVERLREVRPARPGPARPAPPLATVLNRAPPPSGAGQAGQGQPAPCLRARACACAGGAGGGGGADGSEAPGLLGLPGRWAGVISLKALLRPLRATAAVARARCARAGVRAAQVVLGAAGAEQEQGPGLL